MCNKEKMLAVEEQAKARNYEEVTLRIIHFTSEDVIRTSLTDTGVKYPDGWGGAN
jgi:hypothetical protein